LLNQSLHSQLVKPLFFGQQKKVASGFFVQVWPDKKGAPSVDCGKFIQLNRALALNAAPRNTRLDAWAVFVMVEGERGRNDGKFFNFYNGILANYSA
jgi:hypothetical protein